MLDLVVVDGQARGIVTRNLITGELERHEGQAVLLCTGGYGTRLLPVDQRRELERDGRVARAQARRAVRQSVLHADSSDLHPGERRSPVEADAHVGDAAQRRPRLGAEEEGRYAAARSDSRHRARLLPRAAVSELRQPRAARRRVARREAAVATKASASATPGLSVYLDFKDAIERLGVEVIKARYGNLFEMYERITAEDPYKVPMRIYPAIHYTMGGLWVDYNLESTIPGLFVLGEANFSDHGANRLGASALMQGLADGYFIAPYTVANYLASAKLPKSPPTMTRSRRRQADAQARIDRCWHQRQAHRAAFPPRSSATSCGTTSGWPATKPG